MIVIYPYCHVSHFWIFFFCICDHKGPQYNLYWKLLILRRSGRSLRMKLSMSLRCSTSSTTFPSRYVLNRWWQLLTYLFNNLYISPPLFPVYLIIQHFFSSTEIVSRTEIGYSRIGPRIKTYSPRVIMWERRHRSTVPLHLWVCTKY